MSKPIALTTLALLTLALVAALIGYGPLPQDVAYHQFADTRTLFGVANALNTLSNLPFILVGIFGLVDLARGDGARYLPSLKTAYGLLYAGAILVGFGSGYYHLVPDNHSLIWDRLPMTLAFMALFAIVVAEFACEKCGVRLLWPAVVLGAASVVYWAVTESLGRGDLRPYAVVQFLPLLIMPALMLAYRSRFTLVSGYWYLLLCYVLAKAAEHFDGEIFAALAGVVSGHSLKHLLAALGLLVLAVTYRRRAVQAVG